MQRAGTEDKEGVHEPRDVGSVRKLEKAREWILKNLWKEREHIAF